MTNLVLRFQALVYCKDYSPLQQSLRSTLVLVALSPRTSSDTPCVSPPIRPLSDPYLFSTKHTRLTHHTLCNLSTLTLPYLTISALYPPQPSHRLLPNGESLLDFPRLPHIITSPASRHYPLKARNVVPRPLFERGGGISGVKEWARAAGVEWRAEKKRGGEERGRPWVRVRVTEKMIMLGASLEGQGDSDDRAKTSSLPRSMRCQPCIHPLRSHKGSHASERIRFAEVPDELNPVYLNLYPHSESWSLPLYAPVLLLPSLLPQLDPRNSLVQALEQHTCLTKKLRRERMTTRAFLCEVEMLAETKRAGERADEEERYVEGSSQTAPVPSGCLQAQDRRLLVCQTA